MRSRSIWIIGGAVLALPPLGYCLIGIDGSDALPPQHRPSETTSPSKSLRLERAREQRTRSTGAAATQIELNATRERLGALETKLEALQAGSAAAERNVVPHDEPAAVGELSEADLGQWMEGVLEAEPLDDLWTQQASLQLEQSLAQLPGVQLDALDCGQRFCRAHVSQRNGELPEVQELFGALPESQEGFTVTSPDGLIAIYFARRGQTLGDLRSEARPAIELE